MEKVISVKDKTLGTLSGRDAIFLDSFSQDEFGNLTFCGEINSTLSENSQGKKFVPYTLKFSGVIAYYVCELDTYFDMYDTAEESSFVLVEGSKWLSKFPMTKGKAKHYRLYTYDFVYNIIAVSHELEVNI